MSEWVSRVALETVGQTILGYSFDPLDSPAINPYTAAVKELMYEPIAYLSSVVLLMIFRTARLCSLFLLSGNSLLSYRGLALQLSEEGWLNGFPTKLFKK